MMTALWFIGGAMIGATLGCLAAGLTYASKMRRFIEDEETMNSEAEQ